MQASTVNFQVRLGKPLVTILPLISFNLVLYRNRHHMCSGHKACKLQCCLGLNMHFALKPGNLRSRGIVINSDQ